MNSHLEFENYQTDKYAGVEALKREERKKQKTCFENNGQLKTFTSNIH